MAIDASGSSAGAGGLDMNTLLQQALAGKSMDGIFGDTKDTAMYKPESPM